MSTKIYKAGHKKEAEIYWTDKDGLSEVEFDMVD
jgi:hypothetical protein